MDLGWYKKGCYIGIVGQAIILILIFMLLTFSKSFSLNNSSSQVIIYLETQFKKDDRFRIVLDSILMVSDNESILVLDKPKTINSELHSGSQILIAEVYVPAGSYKYLRLFFESANIEIDGETYLISTGNFGTTVHINQNISANRTHPIFLYWPLKDIDPEDNYHTIQINHQQARIPPPGSLLFITNEDSDNITVIDRFQLKVVDIIKSGDSPRGMVYSKLFQQLYIANSGDNTITVLDPASRQVIRTIYLDYGDEPSRLEISYDGMSLYVLNYGSNSIVTYELPSFYESDRQSVEIGPSGFTVDRFHVYVSCKAADYLSVYSPANQSMAISYETSGAPGELFAVSELSRLFVAEDGQNAVSIFDTQIGSRIETINLCGNVSGFAYDPTSGKLFLSEKKCEEINIIETDNYLVLGRIQLPGQPGLIRLEPERRNLYIIIPNENMLAVANIINQKITATLEVGKKPFMALVTQ